MMESRSDVNGTRVTTRLLLACLGKLLLLRTEQSATCDFKRGNTYDLANNTLIG